MRWTPRAVRLGVVAALLMPAAVILLASGLQAQVRPPVGGGPKPFQPPPIQQPNPQPPKFQPPPPIQPPNMPVFQQEWMCGKCARKIGTGAAPPGTCPFCGVRIINGVGGGPNANAPINPNPNPPVFDPGPQDLVPPNKSERSSNGLLIALIGGGIVFTCLLFAGVGFGIYYAMSGGASKKSQRSPRFPRRGR